MKNNALYITATGPASGKRAIALGVMQTLRTNMRKVAIFRPIINDTMPGERDAAIQLLLDYFHIDMDYQDTFAYTQSQAREIIKRGDRTVLLETIIRQFRAVSAKYDFVLCLGTDFLDKDPVFEFELNSEIASTLGYPVVLVSNWENADLNLIADSMQLMQKSLEPYALDVIATIITHSGLNQTELDELRELLRPANPRLLIYAMPGDPALSSVTIRDVKERVQAEAIFGEDKLAATVGGYLAAAMEVDRFLDLLKQDQLVITSGDRSDILLAALASRYSAALPDIAGVLLTDGLKPSPTVTRLLQGCPSSPVPVLCTSCDTFRVAAALDKLNGQIQPGDKGKIDAALTLYKKHVNSEEISNRLLAEKNGDHMTPMMFEFELVERAKSEPMRIVLAEGEVPRILEATDVLLRRQVAKIILLGDIDKIRQKAKELNVSIEGATLIDPVKAANFQEYVDAYYEFRKSKGITREKAEETMRDATYYATMMVKLGDADGMVSGAVNTTAHTIRPAFEFIKTKPGFSVVSSVFLMCLRDKVLAFADCAVNPNPTAQQLAEIAIASAHTARAFGIVPRVAMLSYSTGTSGKGPDVDVVVEATKIAKEMAPDLSLEGPLQYDAAIDPIVAQTKLPGSQVAGRATVFIFPDLNTGNNTYKAVQRAAHAIAIGPVLQGLNQPVNDLSRGCTVPDIVNTVAITAIQAAVDKKTQKKEEK